MSCVAATKSAPSKKKMPEVPARVKSSQTAERTMFCDTSTAMALSPVNAAIVRKRNCCKSIAHFMLDKSRSRPGSHPMGLGLNDTPGARHQLGRGHLARGEQPPAGVEY